MKNLLVFLLLFVSFPSWPFEVSGFTGLESLGFFHNPIAENQHNHYLSAVAEIEVFHLWDNNNQEFALVPYLRLSQHDNHRSHFDLRELNWFLVQEDWELRVGIIKEFWGVAESQHLVDIINQTDLVENSDTEDKLGQPAVQLSIIGEDWGNLDLYFLTGFRERTFPGEEGRLRSQPAVEVGDARFEKSGAEKHLGFAFRWSHTYDEWDIGISHFYGTGREPTLLPEIGLNGEIKLIPYYPLIQQTGLDLQLTRDDWLWKLEAIVRSGQGNTFFASTAGFEYTWFDVDSSGIDLGLVVEYLYDSRGFNSAALFQDDILIAFRLGFNDVQSSALLAGVIFDRSQGSRFINVEASRRLGDSWKAELEIRLFSSVKESDPGFLIRHDDHLRFELSYHF